MKAKKIRRPTRVASNDGLGGSSGSTEARNKARDPRLATGRRFAIYGRASEGRERSRPAAGGSPAPNAD